MDLRGLGPRICILGRSGSGKSTLADAIGRSCGMPVVHLDQLRHVAGTRFEERPDDEFRSLHDAAIAEDDWVIDGDYSGLLPRRLQRATGLILLDVSTARSLARYVHRTLRSSRRIGGLGGGERLSWSMIRFIAVGSRVNRGRRLRAFEEAATPKLLLRGPRRIEEFWRSEGLDRRGFRG